MNPITSLQEAIDRTIKVIREAQAFGWHSTQLAIPAEFAWNLEVLLRQTPTLSVERLRGGVFEISWTGDPEQVHEYQAPVYQNQDMMAEQILFQEFNDANFGYRGGTF